MPLQPVHAGPSPTRSSTRCSARWSTAGSAPGSRCRASAGSPRCSASPGPAVREALQRMPQTPAGRGPPRRRDDGPRLPPLRRPRPAAPAAGPRRRARHRGRAQHPRGPARHRPGGRRAGRGPRRPGARRRLLTRPSTRSPATDDDVERQLHALAFWDHVVDAADSIVFRLMFNSLRAAYEPALEALAAADGRGGRPGRAPTACSPPRSAAGDPETARGRAERLLAAATTRSLVRAIDDCWRTVDDRPTEHRPPRPAAGRRRGPAPGATRRTNVTLATLREFWQAPVALDDRRRSCVGSLVARVVVGDWRLGDLLGARLVCVALFPVIEWVIHVFVLHWRPRRVGPVTVDTLLARKHRAHHADPRDIPLVFIPWQALAWLLAGRTSSVRAAGVPAARPGADVRAGVGLRVGWSTSGRTT